MTTITVKPEDLPTVRALRTDRLHKDHRFILGMFQRIAEPGITVRFRTKPKHVKTGIVADVVITKPTFCPTVFRARIDRRTGKIKLRKKFYCRVMGETP